MLRRITFAVLVATIPPSSFGSSADELYEAELTVATKDDTLRGENPRRALTQVLSRIISLDAMASKPVNALLGRAADLVEEFEYKPARDRAGGEVLRMRFDVEALRKALQQAKIGIWNEKRPEVIVWLWAQNGPDQPSLPVQESPEYLESLNAAAERRKLPIAAPLWDLTDQANLTVRDAETGDRQRIRNAARRYESDTALIGLLRRTGDQSWDAHWRLVGLGVTADWQVSSAGFDPALQSGIDGAYNRLAGVYAQTAAEKTVIELKVEGVASMTDAQRCGDYLRGLPSVQRADWLSAEVNSALWRLTLAGRADTFRRILADSRALQPVTAAPETGLPLVYRWVP